jgi:DNA-binding CsgD family transcriptional regulator/predicted negative regulator of RcsB-dependent stress response
MLEREAEMATLAGILAAAGHGAGRLVVVEGSAGIGKTRLLAEARELARRAEFEILTARGGELEGEFAFGIVRQLFEAPLAATTSGVRAELLSGAAGLSASVFASAPTVASDDGAESSFAMLHGLYWLAANFASRRPTLLVVDDLHWADEPSLRWLAYLAHRIEGLSLLLLAGTRPPEQANTPALVTELLSDPAAVTIRPGNLGEASAAALARERLGVLPDPVFAAALQTGSGGNPLFLVALLDAVWRGGIPPTADQAPHVIELGPQAISRGIATRLARLPIEATRLLRAAAILGDRADLSLGAVLADLTPKAALSTASALTNADLLRHENPLEFIHPVVRTAALTDMTTDERMSLHRRAAETVLEAGAPPEQAAAHLVHTIPDRDSFVVTTLRQAARRSLAQGAPQAAASYLLRALDEPPEQAELTQVLHELGDAELHSGASDASRHLRQALDGRTDARERSQIVLSYARSLLVLGKAHEAVDLLRDTSDAVRNEDRELHWRLEAELMLASEYTPALCPIITQRLAAQSEEKLGRSAAAGALLAVWAFEEGRTGHSRDRAVDFARRALATGIRDDLGGIPFVITAAWPLMLAGLVDDAAGALEQAVQLARRHSDLLMLVVLRVISATVRIQCGELAAAEEDLASFDDAALNDLPVTRPLRTACVAELLVERGQLDAAERAVAGAGPSGLPGHVIFLHPARGRVFLEAGRAEEALAEFRATEVMATSLGIENPAFLPWRSGAALALRRLGRQAEARELAREEVELSRRWGAPRTIGMSLRALGLVEGGAAGEHLLREAVDVLVDSPARLEHARALIDLGAAVRRGNSRSEARKLLREGVELAHGCGATVLTERANDELAATGAHRRTVLLSGLDELTASERRVAHMAAEDLSNKEIAQALFVTVKTVEQHLGRVYRKLDISSRKQLPAALVGAAESTATPA